MSVTSSDLGGQARTLPTWQIMILLLLIIGFIVNSITLNNIESNRVLHVQATDDIQIKAQQLAQHATLASAGDQDSFTKLKLTRDVIAEKIKSLQEGDPNGAYPKVPVAVADPLEAVATSWKKINSNVDKILNKQVLIRDMSAIYRFLCFKLKMMKLLNSW